MPAMFEGTYELDAEKSKVQTRMRLVFDEVGKVTRTKQTPFMKVPEETRGHWSRDGDVVTYTIDATETVCTRRSDTLVCGDFVLRRRP